MELIYFVVDLFLHLDEHLGNVIASFGPVTYLILFTIVFSETGFVVAPFLPGDSLLFAAGTLAGAGHLNIAVTYVVLLLAAVLGDTANYWVGHHIGAKVFSKENSRIFKKDYLEKTREFYDKHGGKTIIIARFLPILRTFAPFVAGVGRMHYNTFLLYNVIGGFLWVTSFTFAGYFFGGLPFVQHNFHYVIVVIIAISFVPMIIEYMNYKRGPKLSKSQKKHETFKDIKETLEDKHLND